jgi:hypothetical protein
LTSYTTLYTLAVIVTLTTAAIGAINLAGGGKLGLSDVTMAWIAVIAAVLGTLNGFLPPLQRWPSSRDDPGPKSNPDPMPRDT